MKSRNLKIKLFSRVSMKQFQIIKMCVFNSFKIDIYCFAVDSFDTEFCYDIYTDEKIKKQTIELIKSFIAGNISAINCF